MARFSRALKAITSFVIKKLSRSESRSLGYAHWPELVNALKAQANTLQQEFGTLPATIGRSVQNLSTAWSLFVDETDKANNVSGRIAGTIDLLAANLGTLMNVAAGAGQLLIGLFAARTVQAAQAYAQAVFVFE